MNNNTVLALLRFNMQWHAQVMKNILIRYKILVLFIILMLAPTLTSLQYIVTLPTKSLVTIHGNAIEIFVSLILFQGLGLIWAAVQQAVFLSQPWEKYLSALPVTNKQKMLYETLMLLTANILIWIPLFIAGSAEIIKNHNNIVYILLISEMFISNVLLVLLAQSAWRNRTYKILISVFILDVIFTTQAIFSSTLIQLSIIASVIFITLMQIKKCFIPKLNVKNYSLDHQKKIKRHLQNFQIRLVFARIQLKDLLLINYSQLTIVILTLFITTMLSLIFVKQAQENSNLLLIISTFMLINALTLSNVFARLVSQRKSFSSYLNSLPLSRKHLFKNDLLTTGLFLCLCNLIILSLLSIAASRNLFLMTIVSLLVPLLYLSATYFPQVRYKKYGFFISLMMMPIFSWMNFSLLSHMTRVII